MYLFLHRKVSTEDCFWRQVIGPMMLRLASLLMWLTFPHGCKMAVSAPDISSMFKAGKSGERGLLTWSVHSTRKAKAFSEKTQRRHFLISRSFKLCLMVTFNAREAAEVFARRWQGKMRSTIAIFQPNTTICHDCHYFLSFFKKRNISGIYKRENLIGLA